jgi:[acyl-carrier-protein] S-malonyltransferase
MKPAEARLAADVGAIDLAPPRVPVYVNVDAVPMTDPTDLRDALIRQVSRPVLWEQSVRRMAQDGVSLFVEIGPGRVLSGLVGRIEPEVKRLSVQGPADFAAAKEAIADAKAG